MKKRLAYKVVTQHATSLCSAWMSGEACVIYALGEWTKSHIPNSPLVVFDTYENADVWLSDFSGLIYLCEVRGIRRFDLNKLRWQSQRTMTAGWVSAFWRKPQHVSFKYSLPEPLPKGTMLVNEVKLLHRAYPSGSNLELNSASPNTLQQ